VKQTLFMRQLAEYFEIHLPQTRHCSSNTVSSYADAFALLFQFLQEKKGLPHYRVNYKDFTPAMLDDFFALAHTGTALQCGFPKTAPFRNHLVPEICFQTGNVRFECLQLCCRR